MFRQNPNIEIRNPKQIRIPNDLSEYLGNLMFLSLEYFYFCHCFGFRASDFEFLTEKLGF